MCWGELNPPPSPESQAGKELVGVGHSQDYLRHRFHTLCGTPLFSHFLAWTSQLIGTVVSTLGWSQLVMGQLLGDTDCWLCVTSMPFVKKLSLAPRSTKQVPLAGCNVTLPYGYGCAAGPLQGCEPGTTKPILERIAVPGKALGQM